MSSSIPAAPSLSPALLSGATFALAAGLMWGLVFVTPLMLPEYPALLLTVGRYLAFGLIALPLALMDRRNLRAFTKADWLEALKLSAIGNLLYYLLLASAIQRAGGPLPTMIIGTLPVVIAVTSNLRDARRDGKLPWARLLPSLLLIACGIGLVNKVEIDALQAAGAHAQAGAAAVSGAGVGLGAGIGGDGGGPDLARYAIGALLAVGAVACWTWYPLRNADWLRAHPDRNPRTWATAQGVATLPLAAVGYALAWAVLPAQYALPFGPRPGLFISLMASVGLFASWLGTLCWNEASQRLPTTLAGQLIVFETLSALSYAFMLRGTWPAPLTLAGVALLIAGVAWALRSAPEPLAADAHAA